MCPTLAFHEAGALQCEAISKQLCFVLRNIEGVQDELPRRSHCYLSGDESVIAHYIEAEIREAEGETRGQMGWPAQSAKKLKGHLRGLRNSLEAQRQKWAREENVVEAKRQMITEAIVQRALKNEERRKVFEARWDEVKARNLKALDEGTFEGPIVPIGFRPPEPRKPKAEAAKSSEVAKVVFFCAGAG